MTPPEFSEGKSERRFDWVENDADEISKALAGVVSGRGYAAVEFGEYDKAGDKVWLRRADGSRERIVVLDSDHVAE